ncbi:iron-containing alcohol dehydrogenase [Pseudomonas sp. A014]|uniref:iron-containing alcohol dehydrogenase n=1 Tax=Pseudomonas sp. A014 TaxID=3458058 RepID=UPI004035E60A
MSYTFQTVPSLLVEPGGVDRLGELVARRGLTRVLLVSDAGLHALGLLDGALSSLAAQGVRVELFCDVEADPSAATVLAATQRARALQLQGVIGLGGGSPMDVAKLCALLAAGEQTLEQVYGVNQAQGSRLPLILIPTTAGTGSEVTPVAIVTTGDGEKKGVVAPQLLPDQALLDAHLTLGLPRSISAATGIDAMVHAIEAFTSARLKNPISDCLALEALRHLAGNLERVCNQGDDVPARQAMLLGSTLAGMAFANAPVGAVHALAYPVGALFHVPHGLSNSLVLPAVLRFNLEAALPLYAQLAQAVLPGVGRDQRAQAQALLDWLGALPGTLGLPTRLSEVGIGAGDIERLAEDAMKQTRLLVNNPRPLTLDDAKALYREVL